MILKVSISAKYFISCFISILIISLVYVVCYDKLYIHESLNSYHTDFFDCFFYLITNLGHGVFVILISLFVCLKNKKIGLLIFVSFIFSALITQGLKHFVFDDMMRPGFFIAANDLNVPLVKNLSLHIHNSFPSGHTTSIFSLSAMLCFFSNRISLAILYFVIALLVGFSRIYLSQHFLVDVMAGSIVGVTTSYFVYLFTVIYSEKRKQKRF